MVRIGFYGSNEDLAAWKQSLGARLDEIDIFPLLHDGGKDCDVALVWAPPADAFSGCTKLKGIILQGQGVDHMMRDKTVPRNVPLVRLVDPDMSNALSHWAIVCALDFWRDGDHYRAAQARKSWEPRQQRPASGGLVGIMGVGAIGSVIATRFAAFGLALL